MHTAIVDCPISMEQPPLLSPAISAFCLQAHPQSRDLRLPLLRDTMPKAAPAPIPDQRLVYLHCRNLFVGQNAELRRLKNIKSVIGKRNEPGVNMLKQSYSIEEIGTVAKELLELGLFQQSDLARLQFPELFQVSDDQISQRAASEIGVAEEERKQATEAEALQVVEDGENTRRLASLILVEPSPSTGPLTEVRTIVGTETLNVLIPDQDGPSQYLSYPPLYPLYLPYRTQHYLLNIAQYILEKCSYDWVEKWCTHRIEPYMRGVPEAGELSHWTRMIRSEMAKVPKEAWLEVDEKAQKIQSEIHQLRHSAVHRLRWTVSRIQRLLDAAVLWARIVRDEPAERRLKDLQDAVRAAHRQMAQNADFLERKITNELQEIEDQRLALLRLRNEKIQQYLRDDGEFCGAVGEGLRAVHMKTYDRVGDVLPWFARVGEAGAGRTDDGAEEAEEEDGNETVSGEEQVADGDVSLEKPIPHGEKTADEAQIPDSIPPAAVNLDDDNIATAPETGNLASTSAEESPDLDLGRPHELATEQTKEGSATVQQNEADEENEAPSDQSVRDPSRPAEPASPERAPCFQDPVGRGETSAGRAAFYKYSKDTGETGVGSARADGETGEMEFLDPEPIDLESTVD